MACRRRRLPARPFGPAAAAALAALLLACAETPSPQPSRANPDPAYAEEIEAWRSRRENNLRKDDSWLTLAGLYWLKEGANTLGAARDNDLVFPPKAPPHVGTVFVGSEAVRFEAAPEAEVTRDGKPVHKQTLQPDSSGSPTVVSTGSLSFYVIERAGRLAIRLKDSESPVLVGFDGLDYFPIDPPWRIQGRFEPYPAPKAIKVPNIIGVEFDEAVYGFLTFPVAGGTYRLSPLGKPERGFFVVFGDETNGQGTYSGGRFLSVPPPDENGAVILDFNKAYNPPCVFTPYATCPLPPPQNRLPVRVEAGEKMYGTAHHAGPH